MLKFRFRLVQSLLCLGFAAVVLRLAYLQIWKHSDLVRRADSQSARIVRDAPRRGNITDRNGFILATSVKSASCYADPTIIANAEKISRLLGPALGLPSAALMQRIKGSQGSFVWLKRFISLEEAQTVEKLNLRGIGLHWEYKRYYPNNNLASHLLGLVGTEGDGLSGVERMANDWLKESSRSHRALRDGHGLRVAEENIDLDAAQSHSLVRLALDRTIQFIAERELDWGLQRSKAKGGIIIVQDSRTGEILALASRPQLRLTEERVRNPEELSIPGIHAVFEPGSTFKAITAAAALEESVVKPGDVFDCENGQWKFANMNIHDHEKEGMLTFVQVIERSSNIGTAKVGLKLGKVKFYDYARAFGFGSLTGSEIPGESAGLLKPVPKWSGVTLPVMSFGQEVGVTALQLVSAYSAIANGGTLMEPRIFKEMKNQKGEKRHWAAPSPVRRVISAETARVLTGMLEGVVLRGTGKDAFIEGWPVAGKTGTAQKMDPKTKLYSRDKFIASFCGFAPSDNPRLTIAVIYDEPKGLEWGGYNAGPIFKNVTSQSLTYLGVPSRGEIGHLAKSLSH